MHNAMMETMRTDALNDLFSGFVTPLDREILSAMPLPSDMVDPFASEEADPLMTMNLTYASLSGWIAEAKKEKYYSERFVQLSKLVMKGVTTMARGLVTLHKRGEDLTPAPMQIDDLISVGSYHFRKSYLGVVQFSARHPEIGERLLVNQLGWCNTLMRLFRTQEKLNKKSEIRNKISGPDEEVRTLQNEEGSIQNEGILTTDRRSLTADSDSSFLLHNSSLDEDSSLNNNSSLDNVSALPGFDEGTSSGSGAFSSIESLFAPAAYSAPRAYASLDKTRKTGPAGSKTGRRELTAKTSSETKRETKRSENKETIPYSANPETVPSPEEDGPLPMSGEAAPHNGPAEETGPSAVSAEPALQSDPAEEDEPLKTGKETIPQNDPPENYGMELPAENSGGHLPREGPSPPFRFFFTG